MKFTMQRDRVVVSKFGRAFEFEKGVPLHVPPMCHEEVIAQGAVPEEDIVEEDKKPPGAPQGTERAEAIAAAIKKMVLKGERDEFTAAGSPHAGSLSALVGFSVDAKERDAAWALAQQVAE